MKNTQPSEQSTLAVAVALRMVAESRPHMNALTRDQRDALEQEGRALIAGVKCKVACAT